MSRAAGLEPSFLQVSAPHRDRGTVSSTARFVRLGFPFGLRQRLVANENSTPGRVLGLPDWKTTGVDSLMRSKTTVFFFLPCAKKELWGKQAVPNLGCEVSI